MSRHERMARRSPVANRVVLLQPLPSLRWPGAQTEYSEFSSLGLASLHKTLSDSGINVALSHPSSTTEVLEATRDADVVVVGDFRYYSYFCNPLPLIATVASTMRGAGYDGRLIVAGRHSDWLDPEVAFPTLNVEAACDLDDLCEALGLPRSISSLGRGPLPRPSMGSVDVIMNGVLPGSLSRPHRGCIGQIVFRTGCRFSCSFCEKVGVPRESLPSNAARMQLEGLRNAGMDYLIVWDENLDPRSEDYGDYLKIIEEKRIPFGCNTRFENLTPASVQKLAEAGCRAVLFGLEISEGEDRLFRFLGLGRAKVPAVRDIQKTMNLLADYNISASASLLVGLPEDTENEINVRLNTFRDLGFERLYIRPLVPFPGSALYLRLRAAGKVQPYSEWTNAEWNCFPHGYPVVAEKITREELCRFSNPIA